MQTSSLKLIIFTMSLVLISAVATGAARAEPAQAPSQLQSPQLQSHCVSCAEPDQTYVCDVVLPTGHVNEQATKLFCIVSLAKSQNHSRCAVKKAANLQCPGVNVRLNYDPSLLAGNAILPGNKPQPNALTPDQPDANISKKKKPTEPETLVDLTNQAVKASGQQVKKAGEVVGEATKKTGELVKDSAKNAGKVVKDAAQTTGEAVSKAAKGTFHCIWSLFTDC